MYLSAQTIVIRFFSLLSPKWQGINNGPSGGDLPSDADGNAKYIPDIWWIENMYSAFGIM